MFSEQELKEMKDSFEKKGPKFGIKLVDEILRLRKELEVKGINK